MTTPPAPAAPAAAPARASGRKWLRFLLLFTGLFALLVILLPVGLRLYFSDAWLKAQLQIALKDALGRECEIGQLSVGLFSGQASLQDLVLKSDPAWQPSGAEPRPPTLKVARAEAQVALWPLITSGAKRLQSVKVELQGLELDVELRRERGRAVTSVDDVLRKLLEGPPGTWPKSTGLQALDFDLEARNATLRLRDADLGESRVEKLELTARQPALGQPVKVGLSFALATPTASPEGRARLEGQGQWIDAQGLIGPETARDLNLSGTLERLDLGLLGRYAGAQGPLADGKFEWSLGRSFTGTVQAEAADLKSLHAAVKLDSDGPVAIWQPHGRERPVWKAGDVPGRIEVDLSGGFTGGAWQTGPVKADLRLNPAGLNPALSLHLDSRAAGAPEQPFTLEFLARLDDLFATDMGALLGLKDQLGGAVKGHASLKSQAGGTWEGEGRVVTEGLVVVVGGVRQPSALDLAFSAQVKPDAAGRPESAELALTAKGQAFELGSREPVRIRSLNDLPKLWADAKFRVQVKGKELWQEFGPLLRVLNLGTPIEEALEGDLRVAGDAGKVTVQLNLQLQNQTGPPQPVRVEGEAACDLNARGKAGGEPFASFDVRIRSAADASLDLRVKGAAVRLPGEEIWEVSDYSAAGELGFLSALNIRLGKYVRFFLGPEYEVAGAFRQTARSKLTRELLSDGQVGAQGLTLTMDTKLAGLDLRGPPLFLGKAPLQWQEKDADLHLELAQRVGGAKDTLAIPDVSLTAGTLTVKGSLAEADLGLLKQAAAEARPGERRARFHEWLAALPDTAMEATVSADALARLQGLGLFEQLGLSADEPLAVGSLRLKAGYTAKTKQIRLGGLDLRTPSWRLNVVAPEVDGAALAWPFDAGAAKFGDWLPALPSFALTASLGANAVARLQELKLLPADAALRGDAELVASYDRAGQALKLDSLTFAGTGATLKLNVPALDGTALAAFLDAPRKDLASVARVLAGFDLELTARDGVFDMLRARELLPADPPVAGELALRARYKKGTDRLFIERLDFARAAKSTLPLADFVLVAPGSPPLEVAAVGELLAKLAKPLNVQDAATHFAQHFDRGFALRRMAWTPSRIFELLKRRGVKGEWLDDALSGVYRVPPAWVVENVVVQAVGPGQLEITVRFSTDAGWHPRPEPGRPPAEKAEASLAGAWRLAPVRVSVRDGRYAAQGTVSFDEAQILGPAAGPVGYTKAAGTPCSLRFDVQERPDGGVHVTQAALTGGPAEVTLANADYAAGDIVILEQLVARQGPLVGTLSGLTHNPVTDRFRFDFQGATVELSQVLPWLNLPPTLTGAGTLQDLKASYDGRLSVFPAKLTAQDAFTFRSTFKDVKVTGRGAKDVASVGLNGDLMASPFVLASKVLRTQLEYATPGQPALAERLDLALQGVSARDRNVTLFAALAQDGLPVAVQAQMRFATPFDLLATLNAIGTLSAAAGPSKPAQSTGDLSGIRRLRLELSAEAPELLIGSVKVQNLRVPSVVFDALALEVPSATGVLALPSCERGNIEVREASYNLAGLPRSPIRHAQKVVLSRVKFAHAVNLVDTAELQITGALEATGNLAGTGFEDADRKSWKGELRIPLRDLVTQTKTIKAKKQGILDTLKQVAFSFASFFGDVSGFLPERMEFEPAELSVQIESGFANLPQSILTGKGPTLGLDLGLKGRVNLVKNTFDPAFVVWIASLTAKQQRTLGLDGLTEAEREKILDEFESGSYQLTLKGPVSSPSTNATDLLSKLSALKSRVDRMLQSRAARPSPTPQPPVRR